MRYNIDMSDSKPIFVLESREVSPYRDFLRMYWRMNRVSEILLLALIGAGIGYAVYLMTQPVDALGIAVFITVGVAFLLLMALIFLLPFVNRRASVKNADKIKIEFFNDYLVAVPTDENDHRRGSQILYNHFTAFIETKTSYIFTMGKVGVVINKKAGLPESLIRKMQFGAETPLGA